MLDRELEYTPMRSNNQSTQDAICLARAEFYADLHRQVSGGLLNIADADKKVEEYNQPQPKPILDNHLDIRRFLKRIEETLSLKHAL